MALAPIKSVKEDFEKNAGRKTLTLPKGPRVRKLSDPEATGFKILAFGPTGSGKTFMIVGLLLHGFKVFIISTDMGGEGLSSVKQELKALGRLDLLENVTFVVLNTYKEVETFLYDPLDIYPDFYKDGFEWLVWDGFSGFQQSVLSDFIGNTTPERSGNKEVSEARDSGLQFEQQDWGMVKTGTVRNLDKFLKINNVLNGQVMHKLVTCLEDIRAVKTSNGTSYQDAREPMLQGAAKKLVGPAFDLILNTRIVATDNEAEKRAFKFVCVGHDTLAGAKTRGLKLDPIEDGDMFKLWTKIADQRDITKGVTTTGE